MQNKVFFSLSILLGLSYFISAQNSSPNWYHGLKTEETPFNISTDYIYENVVKGKQGQTVVVAVIDSGVDIEHEDLDDVIWNNTDEIPDNGIDDDNNGYVDDIHGWNFIGGPNGSQVDADTYEMTRLYAALRDRFKNVEDPSQLSKDDLKDYNQYVEWGKEIEKDIASAKRNYEEMSATVALFSEVLDHLEEFAGESGITASTVDSLVMEADRNSMIAANIVNALSAELGYIPQMSEVRAIILGDLLDSQDYFEAKFKYNYNPDFDPRDIVGDDYDDLSDRYYGNNSVEGPDAMHGTHVAGIIAAERHNDIGINGVANNVKIMVLRAVPDGDERDKDVANAIRYAVDNGASVINMSFGKGHSPQKQYVDDAVRYAEKNDVLLVHASGNSGENIDTSANFPNDHYKKPKGFLFWKKKKPKNWISVGASSNIKSENMVASFSNFGKEDVDLFAPGEFMLSTTPDNSYEVQQGTSMAAPVVAGVAAMIRSYFPSLTAEQVKEVLVDSSTPLAIEVVEPGSDDKMVKFSELSVSGGIVDLKSAFIKAAVTKGKKKVKKTKQIRA